jgi:hypothetical protein
MGVQKEFGIQMEELREVAESIARQAGAVKACDMHEEVLLDQYDDEALTLAYKIANKRISDGEIHLPDGISRKDFTDLIKSVVDDSGSDCARCEDLAAE